jgi:hypothetical protein
LNADLFRVHLANDPGCICGCAFEDAIHLYIRMLSLQRSKRRIENKTSAFLNCGFNVFHDLIVEGKTEFVESLEGL